MLAMLLPSLLAGCVDYALQDTDSEVVAPVVIDETFVQAPEPAVDVLFVVDNTGSMVEEQAAFASAAADFVNVLDARGLSYQIGVTSTDADAAGILLGRPWIITQSAASAASALAEALQVGTEGVGPTAGLAAAGAALEDAGGFNRGFRRADASLHVIFVSDGDDESQALLGNDPAGAFAAILLDDSASSGHAARASAVVGDVPAGCSGATGTALPGTRYTAVASASGGVVASICAADFGAIAAALGDSAMEWPTRFDLRAVPAEGTMRVEVNGERLTSGWSVDEAGPALVFATAPAPDAEIVVSYTERGDDP